MNKRLRLNVSAGDKHWPGFVNIDKHGEADVHADMRELPFEHGTVDEMHAIHCVEHIQRLDLEKMLSHWNDLLKMGGKLYIEVPCMNKIAQSIVDHEKNMRLTLLGIFGDPRDEKPGMMHQWCYTREELTEALRQCNFNVEEAEPRFHLRQRDMRLEATKCM